MILKWAEKGKLNVFTILSTVIESKENFEGNCGFIRREMKTRTSLEREKYWQEYFGILKANENDFDFARTMRNKDSNK